LNGEAAATRCGHAFFGTDHTVFATDAPFDPVDGTWMVRSTIEAVESLGLPAAERKQIFEGNARKLLKLA
jgi:aminocarboxymuconate-semialdehyde decarboxylase